MGYEREDYLTKIKKERDRLSDFGYRISYISVHKRVYEKIKDRVLVLHIGSKERMRLFGHTLYIYHEATPFEFIIGVLEEKEHGFSI